jgi:hypothetical protein
MPCASCPPLKASFHTGTILAPPQTTTYFIIIKIDGGLIIDPFLSRLSLVLCWLGDAMRTILLGAL